MRTTQQYQVETSGLATTIYLSGPLGSTDIPRLCHACDELPAEVRTLRLDLRGVTQLDVDTMSSVRALMRHWRSARQGACMLSFSTEHLVVTYSEGEIVPSRRPIPAPPAPAASEAMTAAYL
jgi:ABC-type transporter Mla MlaB component